MKIKSTKKNTGSFKPLFKRKIERIRMITFIFIVLSGLQPLTLFAQNSKVSLDAQGTLLKDILGEIEKQTEYLFIYNPTEVDLNTRTSVTVQNKAVSEVLNNIFNKTGITYHVEGNNIMLAKQDENPQQKKQIKGTVTDETGEPMIGATVMVKGTNNGTITDLDGNYTLEVSKGNVLTISFLGYDSQNITVGDLSVYNTQMNLASQELGAVVVTALGIKRAEKALSYNVQEIKQDELTRVKDANLVNSLAGKVAGVTINSSSSGVGGASKVVMRGSKSIAQSSNALYVIDGVPMFNLSGDGSTEFGSEGTSEGIADINPEDIESISVLTGAAAAALYGSRAANGAIVLTTKKGAAGKLQVTFSSNTEFLRPFVLPRFQNRYGTGDQTLDGGSAIKSWGERLNNSNYMGYNPKSDFFQTGLVFTNSVSVSTGNDKNQTYFSAAAVNSDGMIANNQYDRYNFTFRNTSSMLNDKIKLDVSGSYIMQKDQNMINQGVYSNPLVSAYLFPRGDDFDMVRIYERYDPDSKINTQYWPQGEGDFRMQNPYWIAYRNLKNNDKKRYMFSAGLSYDILDWLNVMGRVRVDNSINDYTEKLYASTNETLAEGSKGLYGITTSKDYQTYADLLVNINKSFNDFSLMVNIGTSISDIQSDAIKVRGPIRDNGIPNVFNVFNIDDVKRTNEQIGWREQTQSIFASVELGWKSMYYLTVTGRNDWASQLANSPQSSFFYPSVGLSTILSEVFSLPGFVNYLKVRGSFSSVGLPYPRNLTSLTYTFNQTDKIWETKTHYPIGDLYPERTDSWEVGLTTRVFNNFNLDVSWYLANTYNQTFDPQISVSSGYSTIYLQTGSVRNMGIEASLTYSNRLGKVDWESGLTYSMNKNKITELVKDYVHPETGEIINKDRLDIGGLARARFILKEGGSLGDLYSIADLKKDSNGNIYVDADGNLQNVYDVDDIKLGTVFPTCNLAWRNNVSWNNFNFNAIFSARLGGIVYSATQAAMDQYGVSEASAIARDNGGVYINGGDLIPAQTWYTAIGSQSGVPQYYTYSATNIRLQEASIGYTIPKNKLNNIADITVSVVGRNLWMIYNKAPFDPEAVASTGNYYQGIDYFMMPSTRNIGFNVRVKF
ncbi:MAG: SusC/RagA family TonB-linked outer membrane protein [Tannerellaceae bacterium]|nr:SusC/RagA family TonB-linked outer membrane protein [Tannerellaceae bacterium]